MEPTLRQKQVLLLMKHGWALCSTNGFNHTRHWLQENGCGKGGNTEKVNTNTFWAIAGRDWIAKNGGKYPTTSYGITSKGLDALARHRKDHEGGE